MSETAIGIDILRTVISDGTRIVSAQLGDVTGEQAESQDAEWWQHVGFVSRPPQAAAKQSACQAVAIRRGDRDAIIGTRDLRGSTLSGLLADGETCVYAPGTDGKAQARVLLKKDGSVNLFTTDSNADDGTSVYFRVAPDGFIFNAPWGTIRFDATGFHVNHQSGAAFDLGGISGIPGLSQIASYVQAQAGSVNLKASSVSAGAGALPTGVATQTSLATLLAQITTLCVALEAFVNVPGIKALADVPVAGVSEAVAAAAGVLAVTAVPLNLANFDASLTVG